MTHTITRNRIPATDNRLGRHVEHDSRSRAFAQEEDTSAYVNAQHTSATPVLDQGNVGSCTGNASTKNLTYDGAISFWAPFEAQFPSVLSTTDEEQNENVALSVYSDAETIDGDGPYPPNDNGSSGLSVARVLTNRGWISGYKHAFSVTAALTALSKQAVIVGTNWYNGMFTPSSSGEISIKANDKVAGGHEYVLDQIDVDQQRIWMQNSWNTSWGIGGRAWMTWAMLEQLLGESGDCTIFVPLSQPAPTPTPTPTPAPTPSTDQPQRFVTAAEYWTGLRHSAHDNVAFEGEVKDYLAWLASQQA